MKQKQINSWSRPEMRRLRYMQSIKVTMAYIQKNREQITPEEFYSQMDLVEKLIIEVDNLNKQIENDKMLCIANAS